MSTSADRHVSNSNAEPTPTTASQSNTRQSIFSLTVHKGASTFIDATLAPMLCADLGHKQVRVEAILLQTDDVEANAANFEYHDSGHFYTRLYPVEAIHIDFRGKKWFALQRDPRDTAVSQFYSLAYSHPSMPGKWGERQERARAKLRQGSVLEGVKQLAPGLIAEFREFREILDQYPDAMVIRYENMVSDFVDSFDRLRAHLDLDLDPAKYHALQSEFVVGEEDVTKHKRRITPENWKEIFDDELCSRFEKELGPMLVDAGYAW